MSVFTNFGPQRGASQPLEYSQFLQDVKQGRVKRVIIEGQSIYGWMQEGDQFTTYAPNDPGLIADLLNSGVSVDAKPPEKQGLLTQIFISWFPMLLLIGVWIFFMRQMQGGGGGRGRMSLAEPCAPAG